MRVLEWLWRFIKLVDGQGVSTGGPDDYVRIVLTRLCAAFEPIAFELMDEPYCQSITISDRPAQEPAKPKNQFPATRDVVRAQFFSIPSEDLMRISLN